MGAKFESLSEKHQEFIAEQKIFFVATATDESKINLSPKGMDSLKVISPNKILWLNVTGSGNESAAHLLQNTRMTIMWCSFTKQPMIMRTYGQAKVYHQHDPDWESLYEQFEPLPGARQIFELDIDLVQTSCGMAVPFYEYQSERTSLKDWAAKKGEDGIQEYWEKKNQLSIDGEPTGIFQK